MLTHIAATESVAFVHADEKATACVELESAIQPQRTIRLARTRTGGNEYFSTMRVFFSIILAVAVSNGSVRAGPVHTAAIVAKSTAKTAKNVGHSVVKGTRRAVHTVVDTLTR